MQPKYKKGDTIESINKHKGKIFLSYFNDASQEWVYLIADKNGEHLAAIKESNVKNV